MKIRIDKHGQLWIERAGRMKACRCRFGGRNNAGIFDTCDDDCPLFREPEVINLKTAKGEIAPGDNRKVLQLRCGAGVCWFGEIIDERVKP